MISQEHYKKCSNLLRQVVEKYTPIYKEAIESKRYEAEAPGITYDAYRDGFDPDIYRKNLVEQQVLYSDTFILLYNELISKQYNNNFYLFGKPFNIDIKNRLVDIVNLSLMIYENELIQKEFDDLYFSIYEDEFTIEIETIMKNLDSVEIELLNQKDLNVSIKRNPNTSNTYIVYKITDSKKADNSKINPMQYPQTIINLATGILRIYKSPKIQYVLTNVTHSTGCPEFLQPENSYSFPISTTNDYVIKEDELDKFKDFFQRAFLSEEIKLAIERFSIACGRESDYDKILDLVFTLEILLGLGDADSIKHKIIIRLINLISNKRGVRETIYEKMAKLYAARNALVHGLEKKPGFYRCIDNIGNYEEIVRQAITLFIDTIKSLNLNHKQMIAELDFDKADIYEIDISNMSWKEDN